MEYLTEFDTSEMSWLRRALGCEFVSIQFGNNVVVIDSFNRAKSEKYKFYK